MSIENRKILRIKFSEDEITFIKSDTSSTPALLNSDGIKLELRVSSIFHKALNKTRVEGIFEKNDFEFLGNILFRILCLENQKDARDFVYNELSFILRDQSTRGLIILEFMPEVGHLAVLPWEYLQIMKNQDKDIEPFYIGARKDEKFDLIRFFPTKPANSGKDYSPPDARKMVVVSIISSPRGRNIRKVDKDKLENAFEGILNDFGSPDGEREFEWWRIENPSEETLLDELKKVNAQFDGPYIIHFYGHARMENNDPEIALVDSKTEEEDWIPCAAFENYFGPEQKYKQPIAFVLQACESGQVNAAGEGFCISLLKKDIPFVVAMQNEVTPDTSIAFYDHFYRSLLNGHDIFRAVTAGRAFLGCTFGKKNPDVDHDHYNDNSFGTPVIYSSTSKPIRFFRPVETATDKAKQPKLICPICHTTYPHDSAMEYCMRGRCRGRLEKQQALSAQQANASPDFMPGKRIDAHK